MPSGKQSKRRRAAQAAPPMRATARKRQASPRVLAIAGGLLALAAAAVVLAVVLSGGDSNDSTTVPVRGSLTNALPGAIETQELLKGIPQSGNVLGEPSAPVTVFVYVDPQCPFCREFEVQALPTLIERYVLGGVAKLELRPIAFIGPDSERGRAALIAGGEQNKMFNVAQLLYLNQGAENSGWLSDDLVQSVAASIPGVDVPRLLADRSASSVADQAATFDADASTDAVTSTPTILVGKSGQKAELVALATATDAEPVARAIEAAQG